MFGTLKRSFPVLRKFNGKFQNGKFHFSVDDKHNRHRHHTKNAVPSQSSPLARTDVKANTRGGSSSQAASKAAPGQSQQLQQQSKGARLAAPPSGGARRSNSSVESANSSSRAGAESRPSPALSSNGFGSRLRAGSAAQWTWNNLWTAHKMQQSSLLGLDQLLKSLHFLQGQFGLILQA